MAFMEQQASAYYQAKWRHLEQEVNYEHSRVKTAQLEDVAHFENNLMAQFTSVEHNIAQQYRQEVMFQTTHLINGCDLARTQHDTQMTSLRNELAQAVSHQPKPSNASIP
eukprot:2603968-Amphidinium_carterae.1